ncbi:glycosyltransferase family 2 protein [Aquabacterium sp.]|uniref:glycosyltransferase family 2 protein n=1 Tax=Aquabacterium sp. TaxID=1872578 RepID=UPI003D6CDB64
MDKALKITVMIPTYNQAPFIREAIDSALGQSYANIEVVVGDDASTDETQRIVSDIHDKRLRYIRNPVNLGRAGNYRNLLYVHATGDHVVNLDGDDYFTDPSFLSEAVKLIVARPGVVMVVAKVTADYANGAQISSIPKATYTDGMTILRRMPKQDYCIMHMGAVYARKHALAIDFYRSTAISSDWESLYRLALRGEVGYLDRNIGIWRIHGHNETGTTDESKIFENLNIWPAIFSEAILQGMGTWKAHFCMSRCIAFFTQSGSTRVSLNGNRRLMLFLIGMGTRYKTAFLLLLLTPEYALRIALSFLGYYRRKKKAL